MPDANVITFPVDRARPPAEPLAAAAARASRIARDVDAAHMARAERVAGLILKIEDALSHAALTGDDSALPPVSWHTGRDFQRRTTLQLVIRGFRGREIYTLDGEEAAMLGRGLFADPGEAGAAEIGARLLAIGDAITAMNAPLVRGRAKVRAALEVARQSANHLAPARPRPATPRWGLPLMFLLVVLALAQLRAVTIDTASRAGTILP